MNPVDITDWILARYADLHPQNKWGETSFFVNPEKRLPSGSYFATLKEKDGDNDQASNLDREGIFRLNFGPGKVLFQDRFGKPPKRPSKGGIVDGPWDFTALDTLMPHPVYGWMSWMCILNPSQSSFQQLTPLLDAAYDKARKAVMKRL